MRLIIANTVTLMLTFTSGCSSVNGLNAHITPNFRHSAVVAQPPDKHPWPVVGAIRTQEAQCFADDNGCRTFTIAHQGDLAARYVWGCARKDSGQVDRAKQDLRDAAAAGYAISRTWWRFDDEPGSEWQTAAYPGFEPSAIPEFLPCGADLIRYAGSLGVRVTVGPGGLDNLESQEERQLFGLYRKLIDAAGHHNIAWVEALNEPLSVHATSDRNGDNQPGHLSALVREVLEGTNVLGHLGYADNDSFRETGRYTPAWQRYNYVHGWRGGNVFEKIDRRFTWNRTFVQETGLPNGRLTIDGESVGWPVGDGLQRVSATANGDELNDPEALALIALATAVRGIPSHMSGTGVQRFEPFTNTVGWREIPWAVGQLPKDVATFALVHGGQHHDARVVIEAATNSAGILGRADQAVGPNGDFVALVYNQAPNHAQRFRFRQAADFRLCDVGRMTCVDRQVPAGGTLDTGVMRWGRLLVGRAQRR